MLQFVAFDGSKESYRALDHAVAIAEKFSAELVLLSVVPKAMLPTFDEEGLETSSFEERDINRYHERIWNFHRSVLTEAEHRVRSEHPELKMEKALREEHPSSTIVEKAETDGVDLIVMGSRGIGGITGLIRGSTSRRVMNSSTKPVPIVR